MRTGFKLAIGLASGLTLGGMAILVGCGSQGDKAANVPVEPKWKGASYHAVFDAQAGKPNPAGVTIPTIKFTANPEALETRASMVVRFDASGAKTSGQVIDQVMIGPFDISGAEGAVPADYMNQADQGLARLLGAYCIKGKVKISVALTRSSLSPQAGDAEINAKRLSDWLPLEVVFKNPHPKC